MNPPGLLALVAVLTCLGCARTSPPPSPAELRESERLEANERDANRLLEAGTLHAGQDVHEFLRLCKPYRVDFADRYTFVEFYPVPNLRGLSLIAMDGKLVSARRWSCTQSEALFETISDTEKQAAFAAYEPRVFGYPR
jgi:hypothetical protein